MSDRIRELERYNFAGANVLVVTGLGKRCLSVNEMLLGSKIFAVSKYDFMYYF